MGRLQEAGSREGMVSVNAWIPEDMHRALVRLRADEGIAASEAIRRALGAWLGRRKRKGGRS